MELLTPHDLRNELQELVPLLRTELRNELQRFFPGVLIGFNGHHGDCRDTSSHTNALNVPGAGGTAILDTTEYPKVVPLDQEHKLLAPSEVASRERADSQVHRLTLVSRSETERFSFIEASAEQSEKNLWSQSETTMNLMDGEVSFRPLPSAADQEEFRNDEEIEPGRNWRGHIRRIVTSHKFAYLIGMLVITNAFTIGVQTDWMAANLVDMPPLWSRIIDYLFCCIFTFEISLRIFVFRKEFFCGSKASNRAGELFWNIFDCLVVFQQLAEVVIEIGVAIASSGSSSTLAGNLGVIRVLRVLRLVRIMRLARILHLIAELRAIVCSILGSLRPFCWTVMLLVVMIYIVGVYFTQLVMEFRVNLKNESKEQPSDLIKYYHGLARTLLSLYQAMSGGVDWENMVDPLIVNISPLLGLVFSLYIAFAVLAMMNVVTGVFVEAALTSAKADQRKSMEANMKEFLRSVPKHKGHDGGMQVQEVESRFQDKELVNYFAHIGVDSSEAKFMLSMLNSSSGFVTTEEILNALDHLQQGPRRMDIRLLMRETTRIKSNQQKLKLNFKKHMDHLEDVIVRQSWRGNDDQCVSDSVASI